MSEESYDENGIPETKQGAIEVPFVYANVVAMNLGPFDVTMDFGYATPEDRRRLATEGGEAQVGYETKVRVAMSHAHAKSMIPILAGLIAGMEAEAGTIPTPGFEEKAKE